MTYAAYIYRYRYIWMHIIPIWDNVNVSAESIRKPRFPPVRHQPLVHVLFFVPINKMTTLLVFIFRSWFDSAFEIASFQRNILGKARNDNGVLCSRIHYQTLRETNNRLLNSAYHRHFWGQRASCKHLSKLCVMDKRHLKCFLIIDYVLLTKKLWFIYSSPHM